MSVRRFKVTLWPHPNDTTVTVVIEDTSGRRAVIGGVGRITVPVGQAAFHARPLKTVLSVLGDALTALGSPTPPEGGPAPLEGPQGRATFLEN